MRLFVTVLSTALLAVTSAAAQQRGQPTLILTVYAGVGSGHQLWTINRQTLVYDTSTANPPDTANLSRQLSSALTVGGVFQLFPRAGALGFSVDLGFRALGLDDTCTPAAPFQPDLDDGRTNQTLCNNISGQAHPGGSVITLGVTGIVRLAPTGTISPYLRAGANLAFTTVSTIELAAADSIRDFPRLLIRDDSPRRNSAGFLAAGGFMFRVGQGYQLRVEVRDDISTFERVTGLASPVAVAPTEVGLFHNLGLVLGFDVLLEQKRARRY